jgi:hypothetical protein
MMRLLKESGGAISCSNAPRMSCAASVHYAKSSGGMLPCRTTSADSESRATLPDSREDDGT